MWGRVAQVPDFFVLVLDAITGRGARHVIQVFPLLGSWVNSMGSFWISTSLIGRYKPHLLARKHLEPLQTPITLSRIESEVGNFRLPARYAVPVQKSLISTGRIQHR